MLYFQKLHEKVDGILSELLMKKFTTVTKQILDLNIDTEEQLKEFTGIFFNKVTCLFQFYYRYYLAPNKTVVINVQF